MADKGAGGEFGQAPEFLGRNFRYFILLIIVVGSGCLLFLLWNYENVRPVVVSIGLALASLFCAIPALTSTEFKGRWLAVVFGSLLVGVGTWYTSFELVHEKQGLESRIIGHANFIQRYVNFLPADQRPNVMLTFAKIMREEYRQDHFDFVMQVVDLLERIYSDNGHLAYYEGEIWRQRKDYNRMRTAFFLYLSLEDHRPESDKSGDAEVCYRERPDGFCGERTGWVCHLMAGDFYDQALHAKTEAEKHVFLQQTQKFLDCESKRFPGGFVQNDGKFIPTGVIRAGLEQQVKSPKP
jgi:drug/metabolite transporter superfamily protein YnfA